MIEQASVINAVKSIALVASICPRSDGGGIAPSAAPTAEASIPVVIMVVPVASVVPTMLVFIPPTMMFAPTLFPCFPQLVAFVIGLMAVAAMMFYRLVQIVFGMLDSALAPLIGLLFGWCEGRGHCSKCQEFFRYALIRSGADFLDDVGRILEALG